MLLSFVILTFNSERYISRCIDSIFQSVSPQFESEIYVVDNGSIDDTCKILDSKKAIQSIRLKKNLGTTVSRNIAIKRCKGTYIVIMDSDVEIINLDWSNMLREFRGNIGMVVPRLRLPDGRIQHSVKRFPRFHWRLRKLKKKFLKVEVNDKELYSDLQDVEFPDTAISAFWILRREILKSVGLFDEKIFYSPEDIDFCVRLWREGFAIKYYLSADIIHHTQQITDKRPFSYISVSFLVNFLYYFWKHGYCFNTDALDEMKKNVLRKL
ncbi:hypothetical protein ES703_106654 [subsurface metagenome]